MKKEISIKHYHEYIATSVNHGDKQLKWSDKRQAIVSVNWGERLVRALHPTKRLAEDIRLTEKVIEMRDDAKPNAPFKLLGRASFAFSNKALKTIDYRIRCVEQQCVISSRTAASKGFGQQKFLYGFGLPGQYQEWDSTKEAFDLFYDRQEKWDC